MRRVSGGTSLQALDVAGLSYAYTRERPALRGVSLTVPTGAFTALLGPNGAGKTTLMALVTRLFAPGSGAIHVCGHDLRREPRAALRAMGVVFQRPTLDLDLTVLQNLRYAAALQGLGKPLAAERIGTALDRLGVADRGAAYVRTLSGGMKRRVELARALLHRPRLLVLDEPTVGLDIDSRHAIVEHVHRLCDEDGLAVLWATHLIDEIWPQDRIVILHQGAVRAAGTLEEVQDRSGATGDLARTYRELTTSRVAA